MYAIKSSFKFIEVCNSNLRSGVFFGLFGINSQNDRAGSAALVFIIMLGTTGFHVRKGKYFGNLLIFGIFQKMSGQRDKHECLSGQGDQAPFCTSPTCIYWPKLQTDDVLLILPTYLKIKTGKSRRAFCSFWIEMLKPIASACAWPPNMATKEIILPVFFANNSCTIIQSCTGFS